MAREQVKLKKAAAPVGLARGALVKDGVRVAADPWIVVEGDDALPDVGDVVVSAKRFLTEREALLARNAGRLGVLVAPDDAVEDLASDVQRLALVMVHFPVFRDGRGLSSARLLRERFGYAGEVRAVGDVLEDQIFYMLRCGFDAFEIAAQDPEVVFARASKSFSAVYQTAADRRAPVWRRRKDGGA